ncbi:MAG: hypothetical protein OIN90_19590 [Candidatus Methanoperedens sp.]|nr:hypothetical protein [Candidatus Methanoperedens sp.]
MSPIIGNKYRAASFTKNFTDTTSNMGITSRVLIWEEETIRKSALNGYLRRQQVG